MKIKKIRIKLLLGISIPIVIVLFIVGMTLSKWVGNTISEQAVKNLELESESAASQVGEFFTKYQSGIEALAKVSNVHEVMKATTYDNQITDMPGYPLMRDTLDRLTAADSNTILGTWIGDFDGSQATQSGGFSSGPWADWDITTRPWYQVNTTKQLMLTEPYVDTSTQQLIVSAVAPVITDAGTVLGAAGYDINLDDLSKIMGNYTIGETGYIVLFSDSGNVVYHPQSNNIQKSVSELAYSDQLKQAVLNGTTGSIRFSSGDSALLGCINAVGNTGWLVLSVQPETEVLASYHQMTRMIIGMFLFMVVMLYLIIFILSKSITMPLRKLTEAAEQIANGQLNVNLEVHSSDEIGQVAGAMSKSVIQIKRYSDYIDEITQVLNLIAKGDLCFGLEQEYNGDFAKIKDSMLAIRSTLTSAIEQIKRVSNQVSNSSDRVSSGAHTLAQGTTEQASSIEELASTIGDISSRVQKNAENAVDANHMATQMNERLVSSNTHMQEMISAMDEISGKSSEIGKIIKAIEDIAFQTNILALNAAVEAARAGNAGKGFAVVADEVRNLAGKSAVAAKNTTELIEGTLQAVENGSEIAGVAAEAMLEVVGQTKEMTQTVNKISAASAEQAEAIAQVTLGVDQIAHVVQNNASTSEASVAASEELYGQAKHLQKLVDQFKLQ